MAGEDERGITPPGVTAITVEQDGTLWRVTIEQGNGDIIKTLDLTYMERAQLGMLLDGPMRHVEFVDHTRPPLAGNLAHWRTVGA